MSGLSDDDVRRAADIREWLTKQIADKQDELERLRNTLSIIDSLLKQGSFKAAASYGGSSFPQAQAQMHTRQTAASTTASAVPPQKQLTAPKQTSFTASSSGDGNEIRQLKRPKDEFLLANAEVNPNQVIISPAQGVPLNSGTPPFRSFFLARILDGMKNKDAEKIAQGAIKETEGLNYSVEEDPDGLIRRITINNYRDRERLGEIFNTSSWVFTRMLEKTGPQ
jgi:hypothetical protein